MNIVYGLLQGFQKDKRIDRFPDPDIVQVLHRSIPLNGNGGCEEKVEE